MCFSLEASVGFTLLAFGVAAVLQARGHPFRRVFLFVYFGCMEALQAGGYLVLDDCSHWFNKAMTLGGYLHICFQPLVANLFFFGSRRYNSRRASVDLILQLCAVGGFLMACRLPYSPLAFLGDVLGKWIPDLPGHDQAGTNCSATDHLCGPQLCTLKGERHLGWTLPFLPATYYVPSLHLHNFLFFVPGLVWGDVPTKVLVALSWVTGPLIAHLMLADSKFYYVEAASTWCQFSVLQCLLGLLHEAPAMLRKRKAVDANGKPSHKTNGVDIKAKAV